MPEGVEGFTESRKWLYAGSGKQREIYTSRKFADGKFVWEMFVGEWRTQYQVYGLEGLIDGFHSGLLTISDKIDPVAEE